MGAAGQVFKNPQKGMWHKDTPGEGRGDADGTQAPREDLQRHALPLCHAPPSQVHRGEIYSVGATSAINTATSGRHQRRPCTRSLLVWWSLWWWWQHCACLSQLCHTHKCHTEPALLISAHVALTCTKCTSLQMLHKNLNGFSQVHMIVPLLGGARDAGGLYSVQ